MDYSRDTDPPYDACVLVADGQVRGDTTYLLLRVTGASRAQPAQGQCADGEETKLVWYVVGPGAGRVSPLRRQSVLYDSCVEQTYTDDSERFVAGRLRLLVTSYLGGASRQREIVYDRRTPERGIIVMPAPSERPAP